MLIIPAIDLLGGNVVRLTQGKEKTAVVYSNDPLAFAMRYQKADAQWIHVVNLDGAFGRPGYNDASIERLTRNLEVPIELGGGIRTLDRIDFWLDRGVRRVIIGSIAVQNPALVEKAIQKYGPEAIVIGIDIRDGKVAVHGWQKKTVMDYLSLAKDMKSMGVIRTIVTDILSDGMLTGPNITTMTDIAQQTGLKVIVSGGISSLKDISNMAKTVTKKIEGVIIGKAIYENKIKIEDAIRKFQ